MNCPLIIQLWNLSLLFIILLLLLSNGTLPIYICISEYSNLTRLNRVLMVIDSDSLQKVPDSQIDKSKILKSKSHKVQKSQCTKSQNTQVPMSMSVTVSIPGHQFLAQVSLVLSLSQSWVPLSPLSFSKRLSPLKAWNLTTRCFWALDLSNKGVPGGSKVPPGSEDPQKRAHVLHEPFSEVNRNQSPLRLC